MSYLVASAAAAVVSVALASLWSPDVGAVSRDPRHDLVAEMRREGAPPSGPPRPWTPSTPAATWPTPTSVVFHLALGAGPSRDVAAADAAAELDVALRTWGAVPCSAWHARFAGSTTAAAGDDGVNAVYFHDDVWPPELVPGAVGQTILHTDASGRLRDADIHLNGVAHRFSLDGASGTVDLRSALVHELGHALGLGHSTDLRATMTAAYPGGIAWRSLEADDRDGVCALYAGQGELACGGAQLCPTGFVCVGGACERRGARGVLCAPCLRAPGACDGAGDGARCIDIGAGPTAGRVCGRPCGKDADCPVAFRCTPTTLAGDLQCAADDGCASGPSPCASDGDCGGYLCRGGVCVGPGDNATTDAGQPSTPGPAADGGNLAAPPTAPAETGGCALARAASATSGSSRAPVMIGAALLVVAARRMRRRASPTEVTEHTREAASRS